MMDNRIKFSQISLFVFFTLFYIAHSLTVFTVVIYGGNINQTSLLRD